MVALKQRDVPLDINPEALILIAPHREVGAEQNCQVDIRLLCNPPQQRHLVLNRVTDKIGESNRSLHLQILSQPFSHSTGLSTCD